MKEQDFINLCRNYFEIVNTHVCLNVDFYKQNIQNLYLKPSFTAEQLNKESMSYKLLIDMDIEVFSHDEEALLNSPERKFLILKNKCGPFKSAYAETNLNYVLLLNQVRNH